MSSELYDMGRPGVMADGPFTVFFRLVACDTSPGHSSNDQNTLQPITPLHTPFTQSPIQSPIQHSSPSLSSSLSGCPPNGDHMLYPLPPPTSTVAATMLPGQSNGVYYTQTSTPFFPTADQDYMKQRAMSADIHHSPPFHYAQPHRGSFCLPMSEKGADFASVSEEMLRSAMPERYDD